MSTYIYIKGNLRTGMKKLNLNQVQMNVKDTERKINKKVVIISILVNSE